MPSGPAAVAPRCEPMRVAGQIIRHRIESRRPPGITSEDTRKTDPSSGPETVSPDCIFGVFGTGRCIPASAPHDQRQGMPVDPDETNCRAAGRRQWFVLFGLAVGFRAHEATANSGIGHQAAAPSSFALASIWSSASTTASNVSNVDAWRALYSRTGSRNLRSSKRPAGGSPPSLSIERIVF